MIHWLAVAVLVFAAVYEKDAEAGTIGSMSVLQGEVRVGIEHQRFFNKNGVKGLDEIVSQVMVKWEF